MRRSLIILALAGCKEWYGLDDTRLPPDAPPDAAAACPLAAGPPRFSSDPVKVAPNVRFYSVSIDRSIAVGEQGLPVRINADMTLTEIDLEPDPPEMASLARVSPEGDELFVRHGDALTSSLHRYTVDGNRWEHAAQVLQIPTNLPEHSAPTRRGQAPRRMMVAVSTAEFREFEETSPDQWSEVSVYTAAALGMSSMLMPALSPDGLRLVFRGEVDTTTSVRYAKRARIEDRFASPSDANPLFGAPDLWDPYITDDCSRLYFFAQQPVGVYYVAF